MTKDMRLHGEVRSCINELKTGTVGIAHNRILSANNTSIKKLSTIINNFYPNYEEWYEIKAYIIQAMYGWNDRNEHHGSTGLLAEIFGESVRDTTIHHNYSWLYSNDRVYANREVNFMTSLEDYPSALASNFASALIREMKSIYNMEAPSIRNHNNYNEVHFRDSKYIIDERIHQTKLNLLHKLASEHCLPQSNALVYSDFINLISEIFNYSTNDSVGDADKIEFNGIEDNLSEVAVKLVEQAAKRMGLILDTCYFSDFEARSGSMAFSLVLRYIRTNYIGKLYTELAEYDITPTSLTLGDFYYNFKQVEYRGIKKHLQTMI